MTNSRRMENSTLLRSRTVDEDEFRRAQDFLQHFHRAHSLHVIQEEHSESRMTHTLPKQQAVLCLLMLAENTASEDTDLPQTSSFESTTPSAEGGGWGFYLDDSDQPVSRKPPRPRNSTKTK